MVGTPKNSVGRKSRNVGGGLLVLEALQQAHAAAGEQPAVQAVAERVDVEQGQREQEAVGGGDLPAGEQIDGVGGEVVVGEDGAFRRAGGAGGVDDAGGRIAVERARRAVRRRRRPSAARVRLGARLSGVTNRRGSASLQDVRTSRARGTGC